MAEGLMQPLIDGAFVDHLRAKRLISKGLFAKSLRSTEELLTELRRKGDKIKEEFRISSEASYQV